jgi:hypothetical protein
VNNVDILLSLVEREPRNDVYAACLIDALMEERGMLRTEADRHVSSVQAMARTAADIDFTADLISRHGQAWHALLQEVERQAKLWGLEGFILYVTGGDQPPSIIDGGGPTTFPATNTRVPVRLPASWVAAWYAKNPHPLGKALPAKAHRPRRQHVNRTPK